jgi:GAF domain-containing protein
VLVGGIVLTDLESQYVLADQGSGLATAWAGLSQVVTGKGTLEQTLSEVADCVVPAVPGADAAGLILFDAAESSTVVSSTAFRGDVNGVQYALDEGPSISAAASRSTFVSGDLGADRRWPRFGPHAADLGIRSMISLPLILHDEVLGSIDAYAGARHAFGSGVGFGAELFAMRAAVVVLNARTLEHAQRTVGRLETALTSRATIDRAIGIIMSRAGVSADDAFVRLRTMSQHEHVKLRLVAERLVDEAVRRARARRNQSGS